MFRQLADRLRPAPQPRTVRLDARIEGNAAEIRLGDAIFRIGSSLEGRLDHATFDFALFGAVAVAIRRNWNIETDLPISAAGLRAVREAVDVLDMWRVRLCHPITISATTVVEVPTPIGDDGLICLSGGVDSTYAAMAEARQGRISHGLLIAGADYAGLADPGFQDLKGRVETIAGRIGVGLVVAETTIRKLEVYWPIAHVFVLAMALAFHGGRFGRGVIAADFTLAQEFGYHPWGNCGPLVQALGGGAFPIRQAGQDRGRTGKLAAILRDDPAMMQAISVCYAHKASGENCGQCDKCMRTKLNLAAAGLPFEPYFLLNPPLAGQVSKARLPGSQAGLRRHMVFLKDIRASLPEGAIAEAVDQRLARLRAKITPLGKV